jgi:ribosomal protein L15
VVFDGIISGDTLTVTATGAFANKNASDNPISVSILTLTLGGASADNYEVDSASQATSEAKITPKSVTVAFTNTSGMVSENTAAVATPDGVIAGETLDITLTYTSDDPTYNSTAVPTAVGVYTVTATITNTNYTLTGTVTATYEVTAYIPHINITVTIDGWTWGDTANTPQVTADYNDVTAEVWYKLDGADDSTYTRTAPVNAGTYWVKATMAATNAHQAGESAPVQFEIEKKTIQAPGSRTRTVEYSGNPLYEMLTSTPAGVELEDADITAPGQYTVIVALGDGGLNTEWSTGETGDIEVTVTIILKLKAISESTQDYVYNGKSQQYMVTMGDGQSAFRNYLSLTNGTRTSVGTQTVVVTIADAYKDYIKWVDGAPESYSFNFTVAKRVLTVTAQNVTLLWGDDTPVYAVTYDGFAEGDDASKLGGTLVFTCDYKEGDEIGDYTIVPSGYTSDDYEIVYVNGTLTVEDEISKYNGLTKFLIGVLAVILVSGLMFTVIFWLVRGKKKSDGGSKSACFAPVGLLLTLATSQMNTKATILGLITAIGLLLLFNLACMGMMKKGNQHEAVAATGNARQGKSGKSDPEKGATPTCKKTIPAPSGSPAAAETPSGAYLDHGKPVVIADENGEVTEMVRSVDEAGMAVIVRYKKSFQAKLIQSSDETKDYYGRLKNEFLSYKNVKSRISWNCDSINAGKTPLAKFTIRGKTLCLYFALTAEDIGEPKYKVEYPEVKKYEDVPCLFRVSGPRRVKYAMELFALAAAKCGSERGKDKNEDYYLPYEHLKPLLERGLVKEVLSKQKYTTFLKKTEHANHVPTDEEYDEDTCDTETILDEEEEVAEMHLEEVNVLDADAMMEDKVAVSLVEDRRRGNPCKKERIVNIDVLSANFKAGDVVTLSALKEKGLIAKGVDGVKVLARGTLDKPLTVEAENFSLAAIKMILLTGGEVHRV